MKMEFFNCKTSKLEYSFEFRSLVYAYLLQHPSETKTSIGRRFNITATSMARATSVDERMKTGLIIPWDDVARELLEELDFDSLEREISEMKNAKQKLRLWYEQKSGWDSEREYQIQNKITAYLRSQGEIWSFKREYSKEMADKYFPALHYAFDFVGMNEPGDFCICELIQPNDFADDSEKIEEKFTQTLLRLGYLTRIQRPIHLILICSTPYAFELITSEAYAQKAFIVPPRVKLFAMLVRRDGDEILEYQYPIIK